MLNRSKLYAFALLVVVFAAGAVAGGAVSAAWGDRARGRDRTTTERRDDRSYVGRLQRDLALTPAQRDSAERIVASYQGAMHEIWSEMRPRMDTIRTEIRTQIMAVLDSTQQETYRAMIARSDSARGTRAPEGRHER
jgi:hypothetical protein